MSKIMQLKNLKNNVKRSGFDLSRRVLFTAKVGEILPISCSEVLPGDTNRSINLASFGRTAPLNTATFGRIREYYDVYFVPYRLLYSNFNNQINQVENATKALSATSSVPFSTNYPYFNMSVASGLINYYEQSEAINEVGMFRHESTRKLLSYLGYRDNGTGVVGEMNVNAFPLLGYQKIYQDYFRFAQWEDSAPYTYNVDYLINQSSKEITFDINTMVDMKNMFDLQYCNYDKDYFHGLLPRPQYGDTALASVVGDVAGDITLALSNYSATGNPTAQLVINKDNNFVQYLGDSGYNGEKTPKIYGNMNLGSNTTAGISILALRQAQMLQKWKEITLSTDDYSFKSLLEKHWNVSTSDIFSDRCTYLGGIAQTIDVNGVVNNNFDVTTEDSELRGLGQVNSNGTVTFNNPNHEYGLLYVIYHAKPVIEWRQKDTLPKYITKTTATDYAIPELDSIGMQGVPAVEFLSEQELSERGLNSANGLATTLGYAPRYIDYKTNYDLVLGEFQNTLQNWTLPYSIQSSGNGEDVLTYLDFKVSPSIVDTMFPLNAMQADHLRNSVYIQDHVVRALDSDGLPY